ncbi:ImpB/MucB/SamB family protein [Streptomyces sp. NPDC048664]|uniref:ImpB/MucB/SamB family protein n=1 Tax=Streptomyces sp. NPDC048664 TaxID=3154505 RepID=UPI00343727CE
MTTRQRHIAHLHLRGSLTEDQYASAIEPTSGVTPHIPLMTSPSWQKLRLKALYSKESSAGLAGNRMMAADASAPGETTWVPAKQAAAWLYPRPVTALPGIGRTAAETLNRYKMDPIGQVVEIPAATLQRLLGAALARLLAERARGHDPRPVIPSEAAAYLTAGLVRTGTVLTRRGITEPFWDLPSRSGNACVARVRSPASHPHGEVRRPQLHYAHPHAAGTDQPLAPSATALALLTSLGLQGARVRAYAIRVDDLLPADNVYCQLSLDPGDARAPQPKPPQIGPVDASGLRLGIQPLWLTASTPGRGSHDAHPGHRTDSLSCSAIQPFTAARPKRRPRNTAGSTGQPALTHLSTIQSETP